MNLTDAIAKRCCEAQIAQKHFSDGVNNFPYFGVLYQIVPSAFTLFLWLA
jgi:hypothetical protein